MPNDLRAACEGTEWQNELAVVGDRLNLLFARAEPRRRAVAYIRALMTPGRWKNGCRVAAAIGDNRPDGVQNLLSRADWGADAARDELVQYVVEHFGDADGVLAVCEVGIAKKGTRSVGVTRQYFRVPGRVENCQVGIFLAYVTRKGLALIDRELYLPEIWAGDAARRAGAGVPDAVGYATRARLALRMIDRAVAAGVPARWVTAGPTFERDAEGIGAVEATGLAYVAGVSSGFSVESGDRSTEASSLVAGVPADSWLRRSSVDRWRREREDDWAAVRTDAPGPPGFARWLLIRRAVANRYDLGYFACRGPAATTTYDLVRVARTPREGDGLVLSARCHFGLDDYEVRRWTGWHRHVTLSLFAAAVAAVVRMRAAEPTPAP
jgi:SRSO17 transposase